MARIFQVATLGEAHIRVCLVGDRGEADLLVYRVSSLGLAHGDPLWFVTKDKQSATCWVFFTSPGMAEVKVYFVANRSEAGWQKEHRLRGKFG
jgi:hypothetical protein